MGLLKNIGSLAAIAGKRLGKSMDPDRLLMESMGALIELAKRDEADFASTPHRRGESLKLMFAGYVGSRNTGADVRVEEMLRQFRHLLGDDAVDLTVLTLDRSRTAGYFNRTRQQELPQLFPKFLYDEVPKHHGLIACEGSMFKSKFANALTVMMAGSIGLAQARSRMAVAYGGEAGSMDSDLEAFVKEHCAGMHFLARNPESVSTMTKLGIKGEPGTDTAWTFDTDLKLGDAMLRHAGWDGVKPVVAVCPINPFWWPVRPDPIKAAQMAATGAHRDAHFRSIYFHAEGADIDHKFNRYLTAWKVAIERLRAEHNIFPVLVAMEALDRFAVQKLAAKLTFDCPQFLSSDYNMFELVSLLRNASAIASSRYHAIVCSMPAGVPSLGVTMDERISNLMKDRGQPELALGVEESGLADKISLGVAHLLANREQHTQAIERTVATNLVRMGEMGRQLVDWVRSDIPSFSISNRFGSGTDALAHLPILPKPQTAILEKYGSLSPYSNGAPNISA